MNEYREFSDWSSAMESADDVVLRADQPIVVHLNGRNFKHFTQRLEKPWDAKFQDAMIETARRLAHQCYANFVFTAYDSITLVRYHEDEHRSIWCSNSRDRIISTTASFASMLLFELCREAELPTTWYGAFAGHAFNAPSRAAVTSFLLCMEKEYQTKSLHHMAKHFLGKGPNGIKEQEVKRLLKTSGHPWECMSAKFKHGIAFSMQRVHPTPENGGSMRHELRTLSTPLYYRENLENEVY